MTALTTRDKWLAAALPALLTLLLGWFFYLRPASRETAQLRQRVINQGSLAARQAQVAATQADNAELEQSIAKGTDAPNEALFDRNWALQYFSLFSARHGLSLDKTSLESAGRLPPALHQTLPALTRSGQSLAPQVWRLEFTGHYPAMLKLLEDLKEVKPLIVPLNVSMETSKNERLPAKWVLTVWL